jgi:F-type H+-transporting ATPase subunit a
MPSFSALQPFLAVDMAAKQIHPHPAFPDFITNSMVVALVVTLVLTVIIRMATRNVQVVPGGKQNALELLIEGLYTTVEGMLGKNLAPRAFAILGAIFVFILASNYTGMIPGVGSIGYGVETEEGFYVTHPLVRPPTADLNMNLAMAMTFMVLWLIWSIQETGVKGFFDHIFGVKGGMQGIMRYALIPIFFMVGLIELISIAFRPVSLSLRLYGNIYAGENLLHTMAHLGEKLGLEGFPAFVAASLLPVPFYFLELLVGLLQAGVFMMLCTVYLMLSTSHDEDDH